MSWSRGGGLCAESGSARQQCGRGNCYLLRLDMRSQCPASARCLPGASRIRAWLADPDNLLFLTLVGIELIPVWAFRYFPSQDGPSHLANANVIRQYISGRDSIIRD